MTEIFDIFDILDKLDFFNRRAGRELWQIKPESIQDKDIQIFLSDTKKIRDFIARQQAEIEKLKDGCSNCCELRVKSETISELNEQIEYWQRGYNDLLQENKKVKSKTVKEFAKRLKELDGCDNHTFDDCVSLIVSEEYKKGRYEKTNEIWSTIDNLVKEMVGGEE